MKRFLAVTMLVTAILMMTGCSSGGSTKTYSDPGQKISIGTNQEFIIALDSNPTTGYSWQESHDVVMLTLVEKTYEKGEQAGKGLVGAGGVDNFRFKALKAGETKITMSYQRPWEKEAIDQKVFTVDIK